MSVDRSLRAKSSLVRHRNVLTRAERIELLKDTDRWTDESTALMRKTDDHQFLALAHIVRSDALLCINRFDEAENGYRLAIGKAADQSAKSWELRAATRLARLWHSQGKSNESLDLLAPIYGWFTWAMFSLS